MRIKTDFDVNNFCTSNDFLDALFGIVAQIIISVGHSILLNIFNLLPAGMVKWSKKSWLHLQSQTSPAIQILTQ